MSVEVPRGGTRGGSFPAPAAMMRFVNPLIFRIFRNRGFNGGRLLMLTSVGARSGEPRQSTLGYFPDGANGWLIIGSAGGAAKHPAWMYNLAKNPDKVWVQIGNQKIKVTPQSLKGEERAQAWQRIVAQSPGYAAYETKTDREIPVVRLSPAAG
jgi:deazaflavin-dependent oxidoreductase (nitroreductase family)